MIGAIALGMYARVLGVYDLEMHQHTVRMFFRSN